MNTRKKALITGITGQDGSYLTELLLAKDYEVHGLIRRASYFNTGRLRHLFQDPHETDLRLHLHYGDLTDPLSIQKTIIETMPDEIYHLGAQSHVRVSFDMPLFTSETINTATLVILETIRLLSAQKEIRYYQASSSEMFGKTDIVPQNETTPFYPRSPYACAKLMAYWLTINYREAYGLFATNGILFNHESPRRGGTFVTRKITRGLARILAGEEKKIYLGNLDARRDWGFAADYVEAMWLMMQQPHADDFVVATGEAHSVREFLVEAFGLVGMDYREHVAIDPRYYRPTEVDVLCGDATKARKQLGWAPKTTFSELVKLMVAADLKDEGIDPKKYF